MAFLFLKPFKTKKIVIPSHEGLEFVKISEIVHCERTNGYTNIHFNSRKPILSSNSIGYFNKPLDNQKIPVSKNRRQDFLNSLKS